MADEADQGADSGAGADQDHRCRAGLGAEALVRADEGVDAVGLAVASWPLQFALDQ